MNKEFEKYIPEHVEIKENKDYFNSNNSLKGGSKQNKQKNKQKNKQIDELLSEKFLKEYFNKKKER